MQIAVSASDELTAMKLVTLGEECTGLGFTLIPNP